MRIENDISRVKPFETPGVETIPNTNPAENCLSYAFRVGYEELVSQEEQADFWKRPNTWLRKRGFGKVKENQQPEPGDLAVYFAAYRKTPRKLFPTHVGFIRDDCRIESSATLGYIFIHPMDKGIGYGKIVNFYRRNSL